MKFRIIWLNIAVKFRPKNENVSGKEERKNLYLGGTLAESEGTTEQARLRMTFMALGPIDTNF